MRTKLALTGATAAIAALSGLWFVTPAGAAGSPHDDPPGAYCNNYVPDEDHRSYVSALGTDNIRTGASIGCPPTGQTRKGDKLDYYCHIANITSGHYWTYVRDTRNHEEGWVRDDLLPNHGSKVYC